MADTNDKEKQQAAPPAAGAAPDKEQAKTEEPGKGAAGGGILQWIILAVIVIVCAGAGFGVSRLPAGSRTDKTPESSPKAESDKKIEHSKTETPAPQEGKSQSTWYYDLEPVVANLNEPGAMRYIRGTVILEINSTLEKEKGTAILTEKKPLLINWLTIYFSNLTLENTRGDKNIKHIQAQILDAFNEKVFPDGKPQIKQVLFKEFAIQ